MIKITDIARIAGVAPSTVSRVFNGYTDISDETKARILKIAEAYGYIPNATAISLVKQQSQTFGVVYEVSSGFSNLFFSQILETFRANAQMLGYDILFLQKNNDTGLDYVKHCKSRNVQSVFVISTSDKTAVSETLSKNGIYVMTLDPLGPDTHAISSDHYDGILKSCNYLLSLGHQKIAFIQGSVTTYIGQERLRAYLDFTHLHDLEPIYIKDINNQRYSIDEGYQTTKHVVDNFGIPDAICASSDLLAIGAIYLLNDLGLNVPNDVSVMGFDDLRITELIRPKLSTIRQNYSEIGRIACEQLIEMSKSKTSLTESISVETLLVERDSTKKRL